MVQVLYATENGVAIAGGTTMALAGSALVVHGLSMTAKAGANLLKMATNQTAAAPAPRNPNGSKGKPDHQKEVKELTDKARSEAKSGEKVETEKKIQGHDSNRKPDAQIIDKEGKTRKVFEAERRPNSARNIKREAEYKKLNVEQETHKVGN